MPPKTKTGNRKEKAMRKLNVLVCCMIVVILCAPSTSALPTVDELLKKAAKAAEDRKTFSAETKVSMSMGPMKMTGTGKMAGMRGKKDGKMVQKFHQILKMKSITPDGREIETQQKTVSDGKYVWT